jgi:hypothetical protein
MRNAIKLFKTYSPFRQSDSGKRTVKRITPTKNVKEIRLEITAEARWDKFSDTAL